MVLTSVERIEIGQIPLLARPRYDKYALTYLGGVTLAAIVIHHRVRN